MGGRPSDDNRPVFSRALDHLFRTRTNVNGDTHRVEDVAAAFVKAGIGGSASYIWALRNGTKRNPTVDKLQAFAEFFDVPVSYFFRAPGEDVASMTTTTAPAAMGPTQNPVAQPEPDALPEVEHAFTATTAGPGDAPSLAERIARLFEVQRREDGERWSLRQVAHEVQSMGVSLSVGFLHDLRRGAKDNPTKRQLECLAAVFKVRPDYFWGDDSTVAEIDRKLRLLNALENPRGATLAARANRLSDHDYRMLSALIDTAMAAQDAQKDSPPAQG